MNIIKFREQKTLFELFFLNETQKKELIKFIMQKIYNEIKLKSLH